MRSKPYAWLEIDTIDETQATREAKENVNHRKTGGTEVAMLVLDVAVLAVRGAARAESIINSHAVCEYSTSSIHPHSSWLTRYRRGHWPRN